MKLLYRNSIRGGGILLCLLAILPLILTNIYAIELTQICTSGNNKCNINNPQSEIINHINFSASNNIEISARIGSFINYGDITTSYSDNQAFTIKNSNGYIGHFINYGKIMLSKMSFWVEENSLGISAITNYGEMGEIGYNANAMPLILNNFGIIGEKTGASISVKNNARVLIQNYALRITENADTFSTSNKSSSHLVINNNGSGSVSFKDGDSKIILDFGSGFEFGKEYLINKIATDTSGGAYNALSMDFSRLVPKNDIYTLYKQGDCFIARLQPQHSAISNIYKSNIRTMNNFLTMSSSMIYPRKNISSLRDLPTANRGNPLALSSLRADSQNLRGNPPYEKSLDSALDSAKPLKSYESFSYRNESINRRIQRQNKRNYSKQSRNLSQNLNKDSTNRNIRVVTKSSFAESKPYYFILTPFINHNLFFESGNYNLFGFDYGFLTAFSARVAESNSLGAHFIFSYGSLGDSKDKDLSIKSLNLNVGLNYKLDLLYDMYLKARGDFYYFSNALDSATIKNIKPNNLGFGASLIFGKDFDFGNGGVLGIEAGLDYKGLKTNEVSLNSQTYKQSIYNLIYVDLGLNYSKYFGGFGINLGTGFKANLAPKLAESSLILNSQNLRFMLDNDKYLAYANAGISYLLNHKNFDMEFSVAYYGNFGDRVISNGGGVEFRVNF